MRLISLSPDASRRRAHRAATETVSGPIPAHPA